MKVERDGRADAPKNLLDVGQRLDLGLEAGDLALSVGNGVCDDTLMKPESSGPVREMSTSAGGG